MMNIDLSKKANSMSAILEENHSRFDSCISVPNLISEIKTIFNENNLNTVASRRLLTNIAKKRNIADALYVVYNSYLYGSKLAVNQK